MPSGAWSTSSNDWIVLRIAPTAAPSGLTNGFGAGAGGARRHRPLGALRRAGARVLAAGGDRHPLQRARPRAGDVRGRRVAGHPSCPDRRNAAVGLDGRLLHRCERLPRPDEAPVALRAPQGSRGAAGTAERARVRRAGRSDDPLAAGERQQRHIRLRHPLRRLERQRPLRSRTTPRRRSQAGSPATRASSG